MILVTMKMPITSPPPPRAIILAGGRGRRLEDFTRETIGKSRPKQYCSFGLRFSLLQKTLLRIRTTVPSERILVVANKSHRKMVGDQIRIAPGASILLQPEDRGTAVGMMLPVAHLIRTDPEATVIVLPSDHGILNESLFDRGIRTALQAIESKPSLVVIGCVEAKAPSVDYGWVVPEDPFDYSTKPCIRRIRKFVEKPPKEKAEALLHSGAAWSTFIILAKVRRLVHLLRMHLGFAGRFFDSYATMDDGVRETYLREFYSKLPSFNFSSTVLAESKDLVALTWPEELGWIDLGTPHRLVQWLAEKGDPEGYGMRWRKKKARAARIG